MRLRSLALPTVEEVRRELPDLLVASGELVPRPFPGEAAGPPRALSVDPHLLAAFDNPDFEPDLAAFPALERAFIQRQIEQTHRDVTADYRSPRARWRLTELSVAALDDWEAREDGVGVLYLEVPVFTTDRQNAILRGSRHGDERFEHRLQRSNGRWTST